MPTPAEIAARKAILAKLRTSFNAFASTYNAAFLGLSALNLPEYAAAITALKSMAAAINQASPVVKAAREATEAQFPGPVETESDVVLWVDTGRPSAAAELLLAAGYTSVTVTKAQALAAIQALP